MDVVRQLWRIAIPPPPRSTDAVRCRPRRLKPVDHVGLETGVQPPHVVRVHGPPRVDAGRAGSLAHPAKRRVRPDRMECALPTGSSGPATRHRTFPAAVTPCGYSGRPTTTGRQLTRHMSSGWNCSAPQRRSDSPPTCQPRPRSPGNHNHLTTHQARLSSHDIRMTTPQHHYSRYRRTGSGIRTPIGRLLAS